MVWTAFGRIEQPTDGCFRLGLATLGWVSWFNTHRLMATIAILSSRPCRSDSSQLASAKTGAVQTALADPLLIYRCGGYH